MFTTNYRLEKIGVALELDWIFIFFIHFWMENFPL